MLGGARGSVIACLNDGVLALLDIGERDVAVLNAWALRQCGERITFYLTNYLRRSNEEADRYARDLVQREVARLAAEAGAP